MTTNPQFPIPDIYKQHLRPVPPKDARADTEILHSLTQHVPITSEKNIWTYWHSGITAMPPWCQRNLINWVRLNGPSWTLRVLDTVPNSPNHALSWISPPELPEAFVKGTMTGPYVGPHSADFLRGAALHAYGGVWMDVGNILFRDLDRVCWGVLADEESEYTVCAPCLFGQYTANHFVAARKGDEFIRKWHDLFIHLWKGQDDFSGVVQSPLLSFVKDFNFSESEAKGYTWDFKIDELTVLGYIGQCMSWVRVARLQEPNGGFDGVKYWTTKVLIFDVGPEDWAAEQIVGYKGEDLFKVLTARRDANPDSPEYKKAEEVVWRLLTKSTMQKITHGKGLTHSIHCGALLDLPENEGKDQQEGTFGELLRYGSVHFEQTRESIEYVDAVGPDPDKIIRKGLLEA